jgi:hypothetical protein
MRNARKKILYVMNVERCERYGILVCTACTEIVDEGTVNV